MNAICFINMKLNMSGQLMTTAKARLNELNERYKRDPKFEHLRADDIQFVPGTGILNPSAMLIGEAPGAVENARAIPFVGNAGAELAKLLKKAEIDISELYMTNVVKYWTRTAERRVRAPTEQEIEDSKQYLLEEIEIVNPSFVALWW
jgi:uracil-DNA glycosylase family 4